MLGVYFLLFVYSSRLLSEHSSRERSFIVTSCCFCCQDAFLWDGSCFVRHTLIRLFFFSGQPSWVYDLVGYFHIYEVTVFNTPKTTSKHTADEGCPSTLFSLSIRFPYLCCSVSWLHRYQGLCPGVKASCFVFRWSRR